MRINFRSLMTLIIAFFSWVLVFELISIWWIGRFGDPLDKAKNILITDSCLGWRQKQNFNGKFLGIALKTNEIGLRNKSLAGIGNASKNILVLGPSSTFGWGVEENQTYSSLLEDLLRKKYPGLGINVINAGQIGFSSWQGLRFYEGGEFRKLKTDVLIMAYGVNDVDRFRFFYNSPLADKEEFRVPKKAWAVSLQNFVSRLNFINLLSRRVFSLFGNYQCSRGMIPARRVSNGDFSRNVEKLVQLGKSNGSEVILLSSVYDLPPLKRPDPAMEAAFHEYFNAGKSDYEKKQYPGALTNFKKAAEIKPDESVVYYYLSSCHSYLGNCRDARKMFKKARQLEPGRIAGDIDKLNGILRKIADKNGAILIDIKDRLVASGAIPAFLDPIHFSVKGNQGVAQAISDVIYERGFLKTKQEGN